MSVLNHVNSVAITCVPSQAQAVFLGTATECIAKRGNHLNALGLILWASEEQRAQK